MERLIPLFCSLYYAITYDTDTYTIINIYEYYFKKHITPGGITATFLINKISILHNCD